MSCCVDSLYICVDDMERAVQFYEDFFEQKVAEKGKIGSRFESVTGLLPLSINTRRRYMPCPELYKTAAV